jgi:hypothetical protein
MDYANGIMRGRAETAPLLVRCRPWSTVAGKLRKYVRGGKRGFYGPTQHSQCK